MFFTVLIFLLFFKTFGNAQLTVECQQNDTPTLTISNYTIFQTPNFPQSLNQSLSSCNAVFVTDANKFLWVVMLFGDLSHYEIAAPHKYLIGPQYRSNSGIDFDSFKAYYLSFNISSQPTRTERIAIKAAIIPFDSSLINTCPLSDQTFDFITLPDLIIPISPAFDIEETQEIRSCNWTFNIGPTQLLKVVVKELLMDRASLYLSSDGNVIKYFTSDIYSKDESPVYYFNGTTFTLSFTNKYATVFGQYAFLFVSAVSSEISYTSNGCQPAKSNGTETIFTNIDNIHEYPPYQLCEHPIYIPQNHQASLSVNGYFYEADSDFVFLKYNFNQTQTIKWDKGNMVPLVYTLTPFATGSVLTFKSDGNIQGAGYMATLQNYECICGKQDYTVTGALCNSTIRVTPLNNNSFYCNNMDCNYQISSNCPNSYYRLESNYVFIRETDYIILMDNEKFVKNLTQANAYQGQYFYLANNTFTLQFHAGSYYEVITQNKFWYIDLKPIYPTFSKITLSPDTFSNVLWLKDLAKNVAYTVCSTTGKLEMFLTLRHFSIDATALRYYTLFDGDGLQNDVGSLGTNCSTFPCARKSTSGCFTIYADIKEQPSSNYTILFKVDDDSNINCQNGEGVFQIPNFNNTNPYLMSFESSSIEKCKSTILTSLTDGNLPFMAIKDIRVSSNENIVFMSTSNGNTLFELNQMNFFQWKYFGFYANAIYVVLPKSSRISVEFSDSLQWSDPTPSLLNGIMASPSYTGFLEPFNSLTLYEHNYQNNVNANFIVKDLYGSANVTLQSDGKNYPLTLYENVSLHLQSFNLIYKETNPRKNGFLIEYSIDNLSATTTTTPLTTTPKIPTQTSKTTTTQTSVTQSSITVFNGSTVVTTNSNTSGISPTTLTSVAAVTSKTETSRIQTTSNRYETNTNLALNLKPELAFLLFIVIFYF